MSTTIKPTLFVGFGGTGAVVIQKIKYLLAKHFSGSGSNKIPDCFRFLEVDIDTSSAQVNDERSLPFNLESEEFLIADIPHSYLKLDKEINSSDEERYRAICEWWPKNFGEKLNQAFPGERASQAYQIRHLGRAAFWLKYNEFCKRFRSAKDFISDEKTIDKVNMKYQSINADARNGIDVYVFSSIAGGTGCGMVIDALAVMKHIISDGQANIKTFFAMPSCFYKWHKSDADRNPTQVNCYAALKEFDKLKIDDPQFSYIEKIDTRTQIEYHTYLSNFTYLVCNENMSGANLGGDIQRISDKISNYTMNMIMGLANQEDKGQGIGIHISGREKLSRAKNSNEVTKSYSSFGMYVLEYPHHELKEYAKLHSSKTLLANIINECNMSNNIKKVKELLGDDKSTGTTDSGKIQRKVWIDKFYKIKNAYHIGLTKDKYIVYMNMKRRKILANIIKDYKKEIQRIDGYYSDKIHLSGSWLINTEKDLLKDPNYGVHSVETLLNELKGRINAFNTNLKTQKDGIEKLLFTQNKINDIEGRYKNISKLMKTTANREKQIRNLLTKLNEDLSNRKIISEIYYIKKIITSIRDEIIEKHSTNIDSLIEDLNSGLHIQRDYCKGIADDLYHKFTTGKYFGCDENNISEIERQCNEEIHGNKYYLNNIREKIADNFEWKDDYFQEAIETISSKVQKDHDVFFRLEQNYDDLREKLEVLSGQASPMWRCPQDDINFRGKYILHNVKDVAQYFTGISSLVDVKVEHLTSYQLVFINNNHGMAAGKVEEVIDCYRRYKNQNGIPMRGNNILDVDSHILRDAKSWPDLVFDAKMNVELDDVIKFSQDLDILVKDDDSNYYTLYLKNNKSKRYNGLKNIQEDLTDKIDLLDEVLFLMVHKTSTRFLNDPEEFLKWEAKEHFPEELSIRVKKKLGLSD